ncbi:MAG: DUF2934 domain-containing protein [Nitratireductor sp.]
MDTRVRELAYDLWQNRGREHGNHESDWFAAKKIMVNSKKLAGIHTSSGYDIVSVDMIKSQLAISHAGIDEFFMPHNIWIRINMACDAVFQFDQNRKLHFGDGFINTCYRVFNDDTITRISDDSHFPYRDLTQFRLKIRTIAERYAANVIIPPPLFYYSSPFSLEILDGVHRVLALRLVSEAVTEFGESVPLWIGFNRYHSSAEVLAYHLWLHKISRLYQVS